MPEIACVGHRTFGHCSAHYDNGHDVEGTIVSGAANRGANGRLIATVGCTVQADCGSTGTITSGSALSSIDGQPMARKGDPFQGSYSGQITEGYDFAQTL